MLEVSYTVDIHPQSVDPRGTQGSGGEGTGEDTHPGVLVRGSGLSHRLGVLELIHVALELLHVLLKLPIFPQFVSQNVYKRLERRFGQLVIPTRGGVKMRYGTCGSAVAQSGERRMWMVRACG